MFSCVPFKSLQTDITTKNFLTAFNNKYGMKATRLEDTIKNLTQSFQIYMVSETGIQMNRSILNAPRIGLCAPNIIVSDSLLNAAEKGCWPG